MSNHDAHVVEKRRHGGDRHGEVAYYAVGPTRPRLSEAMDDVALLVSHPPHLTKDLHDALEGLMRRLDDHFGGPIRSRDWKEQETARAALAKARGEEPAP